MKLIKDIAKIIMPIAALCLGGCAYEMETPKFIRELSVARQEKFQKLEEANERILLALRQHRILKAHELAYIWPVSNGRLTSPFGRRWGKNHDGIDIAAPRGTSIHAARAGRVIYAGNAISGYGNMIVVNHGGSFRTVYAHNKKNLVRRGDNVRQGQVIGLVGSTGKSSGPHVHFEVRQGSKPYNPMHFIAQKGVRTKIAKK